MLKKLFNNYWEILLVLLVAAVCTRSLFSYEFYPMHDDTQPTRIFEMANALQDGMFPVRWVENLGYGYGYPIFNFYAPLAYYVGVAVYYLGFGLIPATKIMIGLPIVIAGIGMFILVRSVLGRVAGVVSSIVYILFPYTAVNIYVRGAVGELYAYALLPYLFLGLFHVYYRVKRSSHIQWNWVFITSIAAALLIVSHNLSALMSALYVLLFSIISLILSKHKKILFVHFMLIGVLSFMLSSFYLLPAFGEMQYTNVKSQIGGGADYIDHFVCFEQLWNGQWGFGGSTKGCLDGMSFRLGKTNILFFFTTITFLIFIWHFQGKILQRRMVILFSLLLLSFSIFMATQTSYFLWNIVTIFDYVQYPWRFLNGAGFAMAIVIGYGIYILHTVSRRVSVVAAGLIIVATIVINAKLFYPQNEKIVTAEDYSSKAKIRYTISKISDEYLPQRFTKPTSEKEIPQNLFVLKGTGTTHLIESKTGYYSARVNVQKSTPLQINIAYFPAWKVFIDQEYIRYSVLPAGLQALVPEGEHTVEIKYLSTPIEKTGNSLSILAITVMLLGIIRSYVKKTT